jgi:hypothetical protein
MNTATSKMSTVKNYYYLVVGLLSILFSFTHAWNGQTAVLPIVDASNIDLSTKTTVFYIWHIISVENFTFGISFLFMAFYKDLSKVKFVAWLIAVVMIARLGVILGSTLFKNPNDLASTLTDSIAIIIFVGLILLGARKVDEFEIEVGTARR